MTGPAPPRFVVVTTENGKRERPGNGTVHGRALAGRRGQHRRRGEGSRRGPADAGRPRGELPAVLGRRTEREDLLPRRRPGRGRRGGRAPRGARPRGGRDLPGAGGFLTGPSSRTRRPRPPTARGGRRAPCR